jgi:glutamate/tyrosine decarboxylase-like PLP-dependent enzyme
MDEFSRLMSDAAGRVSEFRANVAQRPVGVPADEALLAAAFGGPLPEGPSSPRAVLDRLTSAAEPGLVASAGPRYFGFVTGGASPASTAADVLTGGWDQNGFTGVMSPAARAAEAAAGGWVKELLGIPASASVGFVTGTQEANTVGLAAARHHQLARAGWDVARDGLAGSPRLRVVASVERHATIDRSLRLLGLGDGNVGAVAAETSGAIDVAALRDALAAGPEGPVVVCLQSGNVNTGACDDLRAACEVVHERGGWAHVDGAFGLWASASPAYRHLNDGIELADSWSTDAHKWLNVPYDAAFAFVSRPEVHSAATSYTAPYLATSTGDPELGDLVLGSSRRARGFTIWAAMQELGRSGVAELVDRCCALARRFADGLAAGGLEIVNDVVLNQVLVGVGDDDRTDRVIRAVQEDGTCWLGGTTWRGRRLMRISVSSWATTEEDVDRSVEAVLRITTELG